MRTIFLAAAVVALALPAGAGSQQKRLTPQLDGHWRCVRTAYYSGVTPNASDWTLIIQGDQVSWKTPSLSGPYPLRIDPDANPPQIDITSEKGIYRFDADTLVIYLASERPTTFDVIRPSPPVRMLTFKRVAPERRP